MHKRLFNPLKSDSYFLFGQRGSGKSHLLREAFKNDQNTTYIDLLSDREFFTFSSQPDELIKIARLQTKGTIIIDEVQRIPTLLNQVHKLIEETKIKFILSGSSSRKLKRSGANMLAGRAFTYKLYPLTHEELGQEFELLRFLQFGGLPQIYNYENDSQRSEYLYSYINTYFQEEIKIEQAIRKLEPFINFMKVAAQINGQPVNFETVSKEAGISRPTVIQYFEILTESYLGYFLSPYSKSVRKRQKAAPKFYFHDTGVLRMLMNILELPVAIQSYEFGNLFETFLISEIIRLSEYKRKRFQFSFIRDSNDNEIDLIIERPGLPEALIEIKSKSQIHENDVATLNRFIPNFPKVDAFCFSNEDRSKKIGAVTCHNWKIGLAELGLI